MGPSGLVLRDLSGFANHGTLTGMSASTDWVVGETGWALDFDGANDYVDIGDDVRLLDVASPFTLSWWELVGSSPGTHQAIAGFFPTGASQRFLVFRSSGAAYENLACGPGSSVAVPTFPTAPSMPSGVGIWRHWALVGHAGMASAVSADYSLYVDNISHVGIVDGGFGSVAAPRNVIGWDGADPSWKGRLNNVSLHNRALSRNEISRLAADPKAFVRQRPRRVAYSIPAGNPYYYYQQQAAVLG